MMYETWVKVCPLYCSCGHRFNLAAGIDTTGDDSMFAIVYKADGFPICCQMDGVSPDPVVIWTSEGAAKAFIDSKNGQADFQPLEVTDQNMESLAKAIGCAVEQLTMEPYPG